MKFLTGTAAILAATTSLASAGGLDRSSQNINILFERGNYVELSFGFTDPSVDGTDTSPFSSAFGESIGNTGSNFTTAGFGLKYQFTDKTSFALIIDEPYGSDVTYPGDNTTALGGTEAIVDSYAVTGIARYKFDDNWSVHGGLRYQEISANVTLSGAAYGGLNGYNGAFESDGAFGYLIGGAYERPDIALRVALTYNSKITHDLRTTETINGIGVNLINPTLAARSETEVEAPESINLDFQSGIAPDTLLFGNVRYASYEDTVVSPIFFDAAVEPTIENTSLTTIEDSTDVSLGVARRFNENWSGSIAVGWSSKGDDDLVSPLAPRNGSQSITLGARYEQDAMVISGGIRYTALGDARPETGTPDVERAVFEDNSAVSVGVRVGFRF
ncbi:OmpP1/FadL family transporter [Litoreibacter roseus]|uniref:Membrane protein n=1 Tax=Litoreibacter roseus TaxID=2601869 RepID=A0A6N6JEB7_9RHOB|nr:outer membrane protein transport protein [Litoreibacter roseus]GFE63719.1 membrane protein [Litoreibacter roseus]